MRLASRSPIDILEVVMEPSSPSSRSRRATRSGDPIRHADIGDRTETGRGPDRFGDRELLETLDCADLFRSAAR